jgi:serine/threonine-protein kinase RsbW
VLVISVLQAERHVPEAIAVGADDYLQKPVDIKELRATVLRLLDDQRTPSRTAQAVRLGEDAPAQVRSTQEGEFVDLVLGSDAAEAERVTRIVQRVLPADTDPQVRANIRLALEEIVRNAVEWGNNNDPSKRVRLAYCLRPDRILFRIEDEGEGFNPAGVADPSLDPMAHVAARRAAGKRMGGWGLFLTRKMVDAVTFSPRGNVVKLTTFFHPHGGGDAT